MITQELVSGLAKDSLTRLSLTDIIKHTFIFSATLDLMYEEGGIPSEPQIEPPEILMWFDQKFGLATTCEIESKLGIRFNESILRILGDAFPSRREFFNSLRIGRHYLAMVRNSLRESLRSGCSSLGMPVGSRQSRFGERVTLSPFSGKYLNVGCVVATLREYIVLSGELPVSSRVSIETCLPGDNSVAVTETVFPVSFALLLDAANPEEEAGLVTAAQVLLDSVQASHHLAFELQSFEKPETFARCVRIRKQRRDPFQPSSKDLAFNIDGSVQQAKSRQHRHAVAARKASLFVRRTLKSQTVKES